jgi:hypothetical protein
MSRRLAFKALRNGAALGTHELAFAAQGGTLTVGVAIDWRPRSRIMVVSVHGPGQQLIVLGDRAEA